MLKGFSYLFFISLVLISGVFACAFEIQPTNKPTEQSKTINETNSQSAVVTKFKEIFQNNEQKPKRMRSKNIVKTKEKIRQQELLRRQKENEIKYLERKMQEKQKTLDRLER